MNLCATVTVQILGNPDRDGKSSHKQMFTNSSLTKFCCTRRSEYYKFFNEELSFAMLESWEFFKEAA